MIAESVLGFVCWSDHRPGIEGNVWAATLDFTVVIRVDSIVRIENAYEVTGMLDF